MEFYRIIGDKLIQLSDKALDGYREVIEDEMPEEKDGFYITFEYLIIDNEVHKVYHYNEIVEDEDVNNDR